MIDRKELKANAWAAMRGVKPYPALVTLAVVAILAVTRLLSLNISGDLAIYRGTLGYLANNQIEEAVALFQSGQGLDTIPWLLTLALNLMTMVVSMGYSLYALRLMRGEKPGFGDVLDSFGMFLRVVMLSLMRSIIISLMTFVYAIPAAFFTMVMDPWVASLVSLPFLIPMYIVAYSFRLADFILLDNPAYSSISCLMLSRAAMKGRKWELFKLDLSFFGWYLLCIIPVTILWLKPYRAAASAGFYDAVMPGFMEEFKNRPRPQVPIYRAPHGWSVPGEEQDEDAEEMDEDDES